MFGWLVGGLVCLVVWLFGWLVGWLVGCLFVCLFVCFCLQACFCFVVSLSLCWDVTGLNLPAHIPNWLSAALSLSHTHSHTLSLFMLMLIGACRCFRRPAPAQLSEVLDSIMRNGSTVVMNRVHELHHNVGTLSWALERVSGTC